MFKGFKPQGLQKIASKMGYAGEMEKFDQYLEQNPAKQREMIVYQAKAQQMAKGGVVRRFVEGGDRRYRNTSTYFTGSGRRFRRLQPSSGRRIYNNAYRAIP